MHCRRRRLVGVQNERRQVGFIELLAIGAILVKVGLV
jgi:hypothetical protein